MNARGKIVVAMLAGTALIAAPATIGFSPRFIWNASASVPVGLYRVEASRRIDVGDLAVVMPPEPLAGLLAERGYLPPGVPLLKHVLALSGATVCRNGTAIVADGKTLGYAREHDGKGRWLPAWQGCRVLAEGEAFFMNPDVADSFDSRYFGALPAAAIIGRAVPVWTETTRLRCPLCPAICRPDSFQELTHPATRGYRMAQIGIFTRNDDGFFGNISTLMIDAKLSILPAEKSGAEHAPEHRIYCDGVEIGAAWDRTGEKAGAYLSVLIDDPSFTYPVRASLFQAAAEKDVWNLHWSRPSKREERA
ncbi:DUF736 family protein [Mesorhizobium sp. B2-5-9]|uniref:DUF736 family protein n=1 Tax=unclassified Mesorhizobium TaxID=325217 RepID=UPI001125B8AF|nr:DUF736 family protein [Mesorhizobium sp. ESP6-5]TPK24007.1 DUF736 family protein [Mesorhizobium sp. B2-5-9]